MTIKIRGFTPAFDIMLEKYGPVTALVYGKYWRYWAYYGKAELTQARAAQELGLTDRTIRNHLDILTADEYLEDLTPDLQGVPHTYIPTNKLNIEIEAHVVETPERDSEVDFEPRKEIPTTPERDSVKDSKKTKLNKRSPNGGRAVSISDLEHLESVFSKERGVDSPDWNNDPKGSQKTWRTPLRTIRTACQTLEEAEEIVLTAIRRMKGDNLTFTKPVQILEVALSLLADKKAIHHPPPSDRKYKEVY